MLLPLEGGTDDGPCILIDHYQDKRLKISAVNYHR